MQRLVRRGLLIAAALSVFVVPIAVSAAGGFTDVPDDNTFKADIDWLAAAGVTSGCNPPTNDEFCPGDNVTREQMAAFMHRLAANKVVDAKTATTADDSDKLNGLNGSSYTNPAAGVLSKAVPMPANTTVEMAELSITTPGSGGLVVQAQLTPTASATSQATYWLQLDDGTCTFSEDPFYSIDWGRIDQTGNHGTSGSVVGMVAVPAGAHTMTFCARVFSGGAMTASASLAATYATSVATSGTLLGAGAGGGEGTPNG